MQDQINILDKGFIRLDAYCAEDLDVVNSARVSLGKHHDKLEAGDDKLVNYLVKNKHGTPTEQNFFRFHVKSPIFVFREWHRHRIGHSYNEISGRYCELKKEYYIPAVENCRKQIGKPGHYTYVPMSVEEANTFRANLIEACEYSFKAYQQALDMGVAKELARLSLPVNTYSEMYWSCNARSLMNFLNLRNHATAQFEIRCYAEAAEKIWSEIMPILHKAFIDNGRVSP